MSFLEIEERPSEALNEAPQLSESGEKYISFELNGQLCCVAASGVAEVTQPIKVAALPNSPAWLMGLGPYRGEPVAVVDPKIVSGSDYKGGPKAKVIVFRSGPLETQFALPIDSLYEVITLPHHPSGAHSTNQYTHNGRPVKLIEHEHLFAGFDGNQS